MSDYTPTTEEILRAYRLPRTVQPQRDEESFADYLSRLSIGTMHDQIESEVAAHRWLALHDAEVADAASKVTTHEKVGEDCRMDRSEAIRELVSTAATAVYDYNDWDSYKSCMTALRVLGVTDAEIAESGGL